MIRKVVAFAGQCTESLVDGEFQFYSGRGCLNLLGDFIPAGFSDRLAENNKILGVQVFCYYHDSDDPDNGDLIFACDFMIERSQIESDNWFGFNDWLNDQLKGRQPDYFNTYLVERG